MSTGIQLVEHHPHGVGAQASESDRRNNQRISISQKVHAEISPWINDRAGPAFGVVLRNLSTQGAAISHTGRLQPGAKYLLEIPRHGQPPLTTLFTVTRCDESDGGLFNVELEPASVLEIATAAQLAQARTTPVPGAEHSGFKMLLVMLIGITAAIVYLKFML